MQRALSEAAGHLQAAGQVLTLLVDPTIPANAPCSAVKKKAFSLLEPERFPRVSGYLRNMEFDQTSFAWSCYAATCGTGSPSWSSLAGSRTTRC